MGFVPFLISMLLMSSMTVFSEEVDSLTDALPPFPPRLHFPGPVAAPSHPPRYHHHHHNIHSPSPSPSYHHKDHPPSHAPTPGHHHEGHPPMHPPSPYFHKRSLVAVQGVVFCKSCKYIGVDTLFGASPLLGAVVKLQCNNTKYPLVQEAKTDKNGYFFIKAPNKVTTFGSHKCKVSLVSSPFASCNKPSDLHGGLKGAMLMKLEKPPVDSPPPPFALFSVGPFAFEPAVKCPP